MRIDLNSRTPDIPEQTVSGNTGASSKSPVASTQPDDPARISNASRVATLAAQVGQFPEIRQTRVNSLARAVRDGSYRVSSDQIADSVFSEMVARGSSVG